VFDHSSFDAHERVVYFNDPQSGLKAIIAVHSTALGPAGGGCRLWTYPDPSEAVTDVLRLSRGMSYKNAMANLPMGGGKAVILGPVPDDRRAGVFAAFGRAVETLDGAYVTAEDVGVSPTDLETAARHTSFISGIETQDGVGGNPSPHTARGVCLGLEAAVRFALNRPDIAGLKVAVQGLGGVGMNLARLLHERGASLVVADLSDARVEEARDLFAASVAGIDDILLSDVDVIAPCALGAVITPDVARRLSARVVAGGANNQLSNASAGQVLQERGITYAPDYVINAAGIIIVCAEYFRNADKAVIDTQIDAIGPRTTEILETARRAGEPSGVTADRLARGILAAAAHRG
jgi:leucine dehydrogenase